MSSGGIVSYQSFETLPQYNPEPWQRSGGRKDRDFSTLQWLETSSQLIMSALLFSFCLYRASRSPRGQIFRLPRYFSVLFHSPTCREELLRPLEYIVSFPNACEHFSCSRVIFSILWATLSCVCRYCWLRQLSRLIISLLVVNKHLGELGFFRWSGSEL